MAMSNHYLPSESMIELAYEQGESITAEAKQVLDKFGLSRSINPNLHLCVAKRLAIAAPSPRAAPVITIVLFSISTMLILF